MAENSNLHSGLSSDQAKASLLKNGYNELPTSKPKGIGRIALEVIKEPMFVLLLGCASLYIILGDYNEGIILFCSVFVIIFITFYQHRKTEKSLEALRQIASPRALVIRDGAELRIAGREVVPDDLILLHEGDRVPADAQVLESNNLTIDESILTGESVPVQKIVDQAGQDLVYSGTLVVQGRGLARVHATGTKTQFGKIGASLESIDHSATQLQKEMKLLIRNLFIISALISVTVVTAFYLTRGSFIEALLNGLASAMALLPEEFPVVFTIFLALGAWRLSRINVLTRNPVAIETLGSATVLCTDKTGTITQNKMQVAVLQGLTERFMRESLKKESQEKNNLIHTLFWSSGDKSIDPMDRALVEQFEQQGMKPDGQSLVKEYPLSRELFAMTRVIEDPSGACTAYCKGAPEAVLKLCQLNATEIEQHLKTVQELAAQGYRILAAAKESCRAQHLPEKQTGFEFKLVGFVGFEDPIRPEVPDAIQQCRDAGIKVIMITGDYPETAKSIANQIGLDPESNVITGAELQKMTREDLQRELAHTRIFARIIPEQKLQLIEALKANGEIVAMTGDGVNDAPALKAADIGVAMGMKGTDVAREASSLVLLDDNFASIVAAIRAGRRIFDNLQKAMSYILAIHIPIIGLVLLPAYFSTLPILLMPLHIVFMELIIDPVCSVAFESEQEEEGIMKRPPRDRQERFFGWNKILVSLARGLLLLATVMVVYFLSIEEGHQPEEVRAIAFSSLIIGNVFLILTSLSKTRHVIAVLREKNIAVWIISAAALLCLFLTLTIPALEELFSFKFPGYSHFLSAILGALVMITVLELWKAYRVRRSKK